jgi:hypothetical protein
MADLFMYGLSFIGVAIILFAVIMGGIGIYGANQEKQEYEAKQARRLQILRQQQIEREAENKVKLEKSAKESG